MNGRVRRSRHRPEPSLGGIFKRDLPDRFASSVPYWASQKTGRRYCILVACVISARIWRRLMEGSRLLYLTPKKNPSKQLISPWRPLPTGVVLILASKDAVAFLFTEPET